jgi:large subunit ribosomal protein L19e
MNLKKKKTLASNTLKVGKSRIVFLNPRIEEIKEAITKQDIKDLKKEGAIKIKEIKGRKKVEKRKRQRGKGKVKKKVKRRKTDYVILTRKLRRYIKELKTQGKISNEEFREIRKKIRNKAYRSKSHLKDLIKSQGK